MTIMKIETLIKSNVAFENAKRVFLNLMYTQNLISEKLNETLKPFDISGEQFNVLRILRGQKGNPANMSMIQERMITKNSNTTRLIDKLLTKSLVTRNVCPENRRKIEIVITAKGRALLEELDPLVAANEELFVKNLSEDEQKVLIELLEKFRTINTQ
jgi:DNA-binding MarR family transcriptional regulator